MIDVKIEDDVIVVHTYISSPSSILYFLKIVHNPKGA